MTYPIHYIQLTTGEIILGQYNESINLLRKPISVIMQQTPQGVQVGFMPYGAPLLVNPNDSKDLLDSVTLNPATIVFVYNLEGKKDLTEHQKRLRDQYRQATSTIILNNGGVNLTLPTRN